ncbi:MAG: glycosyltransferase [Pseudomonadota bacterium]
MLNPQSPLSPEDVTLIQETRVFRPKFYLALYPEVAQSGLDPFEHYVSVGSAQNLRPHPFFNPAFYLKSYPDVAEAGLHPLVHYLKYGGAEWRTPSPLVDLRRYHKKYRFYVALTRSGSLVEDFETSKDRRKALQLFDIFPRRDEPTTFNDRVRQLFEEGMPSGAPPNPLIEFENLTPSRAYKDGLEALENLFFPNEELARIQTHWLFDNGFYAERRGQTPVHPTIDFLRKGHRSSIWIHPLLDPDFYTWKNGLPNNSVYAAMHYLTHIEDDPDPNYFFDAKAYRAEFDHTRTRGETLLQHYIRFGYMPYFEPSPRFGQRFYLSRNPHLPRVKHQALVHFLHNGSLEDQPAMPRPALFDETAGLSDDELAALIRAAASQRESPENVDVTVIIPTYQNTYDTLRAVLAVLRSADKASLSVLLVDDSEPGSVDGPRLAERLEGIAGVGVMENEANLGFLLSCNRAAESCHTPFVYFLNNDTLVVDGWLDEALATAREDDTIGLVGSKLVYPNGLLQEAGGIIWSDGTAANFGRLDDPEAPRYSYRRDVDYVSGAAILVRKSAWDAVGGFSEEFAPAYYEDTDLGMKLRQAGLRVVFQPTSCVVHVEGVTSGVDITKGTKRYLPINKEKFIEKWRDALPNQGVFNDFSRANIDRNVRGRVLVFDAEVPRPDHDSGSVTAFHMLRILVALGFHVTALPLSGERLGRYTRQLQRMGVEVLYAPYVDDAKTFAVDHAGEFDFVILTRITAGGQFIGDLRRRYRDLKIVFDTVDLHHLRAHREAELAGDPEMAKEANRIRRAELNAIAAADLTIVTSEHEIQYLRDEIGPFPHLHLPLIYEPYVPRHGFEERRDVAFVGGFRHPPNVDAVAFLMEEIWPRVRDRLAGARLHIIGADMPSSVREYASEDVVVAGFVGDLEAYLETIRLTVAPLRYGAGVKGKVGNSMRLGIPAVVTPVAAEGMGLTDGTHTLTASDPQAFAEAICRLYPDKPLWERLSQNGRAFVEQNFGMDLARRRLETMCRALMLKPQ